MDETNLKITVVGDKNTGKTTFIHKLKYGKVLNVETDNPVEVSLVKYYTNKGNVLVNFWEIKDNSPRGLVPTYYANTNAVLVFCNKDSKTLEWVKEAGRFSPKSKIILVNTGDKKIKNSKIPYINLQFEDLNKPVEMLLRQFLGEDTKISRNQEFGLDEIIQFE